jgi:hypothetical protein
MDPALAQWIPLLQIITNATLTLVGICIAVASLVIAYRNNFGWKPIALVGEYGISGVGGDTKNYTALMDLEIWNRRKYPVSIRSIRLSFTDLEIKRPDAASTRGKDWYIGHNYASHSTPHVLGPNMHEEHKIEIPFTAKTLDLLKAPVRIEISYFDPRLDKDESLVLEWVYTLH